MYKDENAKLNREEFVTLGSKIDFRLTKSVCDEIEIETKFQSNSKDWFSYRSGRITASKVKEVCSIKSYESNISLIKSICYPLSNSFKNKALNGVKFMKLMTSKCI